MPIYNFKCEDCNIRFEQILAMADMDKTEKLSCTQCDSKNVYRIVTTFGSYSIKGNNSASTRPKGIAGRK